MTKPVAPEAQAGTLDLSFTQSFYAGDWAKAFIAAVKLNPSIATDEGTMIGWFANAIMRGHDTALERSHPPASGEPHDAKTCNDQHCSHPNCRGDAAERAARCPKCNSPDPYFESTALNHGYLQRRELMIITYCRDPFHVADVAGNAKLSDGPRLFAKRWRDGERQ